MTNTIGKVKNCLSRAAGLGLAGLWVWLGLGSAVRAADDGELQRCVRRTMDRARASGVSPSSIRTRFLLGGDSEAYPYRYSEKTCTGFLAVGARHVQTIELTLQAADGRTLAHSALPSAIAYVAHCGVPGERVFAGTRMLDGQGEVVFAVIEHSRARPPALVDLEQCPAVGTPRPAPAVIGPEPEGTSIEEQFDSARDALRELGYGEDEVVGFGTVFSGQHDTSGIVLDPDRCYALVAAGSRDVLDLDMRVFGPGMPLTAAGSDVSRRRSASIKLCARAPARYVLDVSAYQGEGAYAVQAYALHEPPRPAGVGGQMRIGYAEVAARMHARGLTARVVTSGIVDAEDSLSVPLTLAGGACYAVAAVAAFDSDDVVLQLGLLDEQGELQALDARPNQVPMVFHCSKRDEWLEAVVRSSQDRKSTRFALVLGSAKEAATP